MTIPEIRKRLHQLADELVRNVDCSVSWDVATELRRLAEATRRRTATRVAPVESHPITELERVQISHFAEFHPHASQMEIAREFGVNIGRVSEALHGKRQ